MSDCEDHEVRQGEWLNSIARDYGRTPESIWDYGPNSKLKEMRDPNILYPGDILKIPPLQQDDEQRPTDQVHKFQVKRFRERFEVTLKDPNGKPYRGLEYRLTLGTQKFNGTTDGEGTIRVEDLVLASHTSGKLELPEIFLVYTIELGTLNPIKKNQGDEESTYDDGLSGALMRLRNLGYYDGVIPNRGSEAFIDPQEYLEGISRYQLHHMKRKIELVTGELDDDTRKSLRNESIA